MEAAARTDASTTRHSAERGRSAAGSDCEEKRSCAAPGDELAQRPEAATVRRGRLLLALRAGISRGAAACGEARLLLPAVGALSGWALACSMPGREQSAAPCACGGGEAEGGAASRPTAEQQLQGQGRFIKARHA
jgi:hypothetical protein